LLIRHKVGGRAFRFAFKNTPLVLHVMRILQLFHTTIAVVRLHGCYADDAVADTDSDPDPDALSSDLLEWIRANGGYINEKLVVRHLVPDDPSSPRGVFATEDMADGEIVCKIPPNLVVKSDEVREDEMEYCNAIEAIANDMTGDNITPYGRYLLSQPEGYTALFWSQAGKNLLERMLRSTRPHQYTAYDELPPHGVNDVLSDLKMNCEGNIDDPLYLKAAMLVMARADDDKMVPFYDMINHNNGKRNIQHNIDPWKDKQTFDQRGYEIAIKKALRAGDELYSSYNRCDICGDYFDWFGTPEIFLHFGFVESLPQRWLFDFARVKFELDWKYGDENTGKVEANFLVPPSLLGMQLLQEEISRLETFATMNRDKAYEKFQVSKYEWESMWQYYDALHYALFIALQSDDKTLSDDVWNLDDDWWVKDGTLKATDDLDHYVLPSKLLSDVTFNDEL